MQGEDGYDERVSDAPRGPIELTPADVGRTLLGVAEKAGLGIVIASLGTGAVETVFVNDAAAVVFGRTREALLECNLLDFVAPELRDAAQAIVERTLAGDRSPAPFETAFVRPDGTRVPIEVTYGQLEAHGRLLTVNIVVDISERTRLRERFARSDKLGAMGMLAASVAHEINNPLAFMSLRIEALRRAVENGVLDERVRADLLDSIADVAHGTKRVATIVRGLRAIGQDDEADERPTDVGHVVASAARLVAHQFADRACLMIEDADVPLIRANGYRLEQVIANLLLNAAQAFATPSADNRVTVRSGLVPSGGIFVDVEDNASGISESDLGRIFDPFFTTKGADVGTGLGLSICQGIVARLGGEITVSSELGRGSTFRVTLPASIIVSPATSTAPPAEFAPPVLKRNAG